MPPTWNVCFLGIDGPLHASRPSLHVSLICSVMCSHDPQGGKHPHVAASEHGLHGWVVRSGIDQCRLLGCDFSFLFPCLISLIRSPCCAMQSVWLSVSVSLPPASLVLFMLPLLCYLLFPALSLLHSFISEARKNLLGSSISPCGRRQGRKERRV